MMAMSEAFIDRGRFPSDDLPATSVGILAHGSDLKRERLVVGRDAGVEKGAIS